MQSTVRQCNEGARQGWDVHDRQSPDGSVRLAPRQKRRGVKNAKVSFRIPTLGWAKEIFSGFEQLQSEQNRTT